MPSISCLDSSLKPQVVIFISWHWSYIGSHLVKRKKFLLWLFVGEKIKPLGKWSGEDLHFYPKIKWLVRSRLLPRKEVGHKRSKLFYLERKILKKIG